jgi:hypothetical protein
MVAGVPQQVAIAFGKSHTEAQWKAGVPGAATVTAVANGFHSGDTKVTTALFNDFSLQLVPLNNPVSPGDRVQLRVMLLAAGKPFNTPASVQVAITPSVPGLAQQTVPVQAGNCCTYASLAVPANIMTLQKPPFVILTAAATGFTSATTALGVSQQGTNPQEILVGPPRTNLTASSNQLLSLSLFNSTFAPARGSLTLYLFSSNSSVVGLQEARVTISDDSATFPVYANSTGTAQITAIAPGLTSLPLTVTVVKPYKPELRLSLPSEVRVGEAYSFSVGFYEGNEPIPYGTTTVYLSSSYAGVTFPSGVQASVLGYAVGTFSAQSAGIGNVTAVLEGVSATTATVVSVFAPTVAPVKYTVTARSDSGPLVGIPVNITHEGLGSVVTTDASGSATFSAYNDSTTLASVPSSITLNSRTYFFTGWSNGAKGENVSLLGSTQTYSLTAQYFRSVVPTNYSVLAVSDGQEPVAGLRINVSSRTLKQNFTITTDSKGIAYFVRPNASSSFIVSVPKLFQPSGQTRYAFLSIGNSTMNVVNMTATAAVTINARYATYYQFQVASPIGSTTGSGWYRNGSSASYSVGETSSGGPLIFQRFAGWTGSFSSDLPSGSAVITSPEFITAQWSTDNSLLFAAGGGVIAAAAVIGLFIFRLRKRAQSS